MSVGRSIVGHAFRLGVIGVVGLVVSCSSTDPTTAGREPAGAASAVLDGPTTTVVATPAVPTTSGEPSPACRSTPSERIGPHLAAGNGAVRVSNGGPATTTLSSGGQRTADGRLLVKAYWLFAPDVTGEVAVRGTNMADGSAIAIEGRDSRIFGADARVLGTAAMNGWSIAASVLSTTQPGCVVFEMSSAGETISVALTVVD